MTTTHAPQCTGDSVPMGQRVTAGDLRHMRDIARRRIGAWFNVEPDYEWDVMSGRYRFTKNQGSREMSPRMSKGEASLWLGGFLAGVDEVMERFQEGEGG
jgi:hypothetical protein